MITLIRSRIGKFAGLKVFRSTDELMDTLSLTLSGSNDHIRRIIVFPDSGDVYVLIYSMPSNDSHKDLLRVLLVDVNDELIEFEEELMIRSLCSDSGSIEIYNLDKYAFLLELESIDAFIRLRGLTRPYVEIQKEKLLDLLRICTLKRDKGNREKHVVKVDKENIKIEEGLSERLGNLGYRATLSLREYKIIRVRPAQLPRVVEDYVHGNENIVLHIRSEEYDVWIMHREGSGIGVHVSLTRSGEKLACRTYEELRKILGEIAEKEGKKKEYLNIFLYRS